MAPMKSTTFVISNRFFHTAFIGYHSEFFQIRIFRIQNIIIIHSTPLHSTPIFLLVRGSPVDTSNQYGYVSMSRGHCTEKQKQQQLPPQFPTTAKTKATPFLSALIILSTLHLRILCPSLALPISHQPSSTPPPTSSIRPPVAHLLPSSKTH